MKYFFEFCALRYLFLWEREERMLHENMSGTKGTPSAKNLRDSLNHFRVSRNFKGIGSDQIATQVLNAISEIGGNVAFGPLEKVKRLTVKFREDFGQFNLSAASKLLWLTYREPFVIYDGRTVSALGKHCKFDNADYAEYWNAWHKEYDKHRTDVKDAALRLAELQPVFFATSYESETEFLEVTQSQWFLERVFDIYLWELGDEKNETFSSR